MHCIELQHVTKRYGGIVANSDISIHLQSGELLGLIGANGAGKTTLFNLISGSTHPTEGTIHFEGVDISHKKPHDICRLGICRTYQIVKPFATLTVRENVMVGSFLKTKNVALARQKAEAVIEQMGLSAFIDKPGYALNLPQLKRLEVARALATDPKVLLLDEVMAGLNPAESARFVQTVKDIHATGLSIIIIEHVMKAVMSLSQRIYVLDQGQLIAEGRPDEIVNNKRVQQSYLGEKAHVDSH